MSLTNAQLAQQIAALVSYWRTRDEQFAEWLAGVPNGGPFGDGRYPLTNYVGQTQHILCPAALANLVTGVRDSAQSFATAAATSQALASSAQQSAEGSAVASGAARDAAIEARQLAFNYAEAAAAQAASVANLVLSTPGSPEGVVTATPGKLCISTTLGQVFVKHTGTGNTGWQLIAAA